jgi:UDP-N-acetylglucosamine 2-epimerase
MDEIKAVLVVGARPQFIKSAPVIREIISKHKRIELHLIHSGQHYDQEMSEVFFKELGIPKPLVNLQAGSGSHAVQTATIMKRLESTFMKARPHVVMVPGDTNTTLAASLTAAKLGIPIAHIEAGLRCGDMSMPEEINRRVTDHCSTVLFAPTRTAVSNLKNEGLSRFTYLTGDTMVDALCSVMSIAQEREAGILDSLGLQPRDYVLVTLHRPSNVDDLGRLGMIQRALNEVATGLRIPVVFPVHPRTRARLRKLNSLKYSDWKVKLTNPRSYVETICLLRNANCLLTDSGGMQKEAFLLHIPCVTLRSTTEWPETLAGKANRLLTSPEQIPAVIRQVALNTTLTEAIRGLANPFGDGHASTRIAEIIEKKFMAAS